MMIAAYILIETSPGKAATVAEELRSFAAVKQANAVTGPFDVICIVSAETLADLGAQVVAKIQNVAGVLKTLTCLMVDR